MENLTQVRGPFFDELQRGQIFNHAPDVTLTSGLAVAHQAIVGDRLRLPLSDTLAVAVCGRAGLAHPALVWDLAIGQSTVVTQQVIANLFYRGLSFHSTPHIGDTLRTTTEVVALRQNQPKPGRPATGLAALRVTTTDQHSNPVLDFWRCAMLPLSTDEIDTGSADNLDQVGNSAQDLSAGAFSHWDLGAMREHVGGEHFGPQLLGRSFVVTGGDVVSNAPELARLTLNIARVHHDETSSSAGRLVYGGHTIGIALAQVTRAIPNIAAVVAWHHCDHTGPVHEGDTLQSRITVERMEPLPAGGGLLHLRSLVSAINSAAATPRAVLDWRFVALMA